MLLLVRLYSVSWLLCLSLHALSIHVAATAYCQAQVLDSRHAVYAELSPQTVMHDCKGKQQPQHMLPGLGHGYI